MPKKSCKRLSNIAKELDLKKSYSVQEAIDLLKPSAKVLKFDPSIELSIKIGLEIEKLGTSIRGSVALPAGTGKTIKIAVICGESKVKEAKDAGADLVGGQDLIDEIKTSNKTDFKVCIATPDMMAKIAPIARILGTKGLMPNPKLGTVTLNVENAVKQFKAGKIEFRMDKNGFIKTKAGKCSFSTNDLASNIDAVVQGIHNQKPANAKGKYIENIRISYTMGPSVVLNLNEK